MTEDVLFDHDPERHIVVRAKPGETGESVRTTAAVRKYLAQHPEGYVVYDALGLLEGREGPTD